MWVAAILSDVSTSQTSKGLVLAEYDVQIQSGNVWHSYPCRVLFDMRYSRNSLLIEPLESVEAIYSDMSVREPVLLTIPGAKKQVECYVVCVERGEQSGPFVKLTPASSNIELDYSPNLVSVSSGVLNLGHYQFGAPGRMSKFKLSHDDWQFDFTPVMEVTMLYPPSIQNEEYFFTHHLCMRKADGTSFFCSEAHEELKQLSTFFSFCHGHWVSTALTCGLNEKGVVAMEEWGTRMVSPWRRTTNWLDEHYGNGMVELFPGFVRRMADPDWKAALEYAIYWYIRSDTNFVGPDGACILLQAALERLAWHVLVRDRRSLSEHGFSKLPAADQLRLLLAALSVPLDMSAELDDLQATARELNWVDGPQAFVEIRNRLVHPPKIGRTEKELPYYDAFQLAKWYVELVILSACGYTGKYSNRTRRNRWIGQVEPVPWAV